MDMTKKLQETYLPDQDTRKQRVVIGLSGGLNSYVVAYLLKIQKYDLIGVTISLNWDDFKGNVSDILACQRTPADLEQIKTFCHQLGIPHFVVKASEEFKEGVVDNWMTARITGTKSISCWNCHELRMKLLYQKMKELEATNLATGHSAKLFRHAGHGTVYVHTSNDEANDQSSLLSRLPKEILERMLLPLSDLQQKEIVKLGENFGIAPVGNRIKMHQCFNQNVETVQYIQKHVPKKYLTEGGMFNMDQNPIADHKGVFHYPYGEPILFNNQKQTDAYRLSKYYFKERKMELAKSDYFVRKKIFLSNCHIADETPWFEPITGYLKISDEEGVDCIIYPKNISSALVELESPLSMLEGSIITILKKKGKNSKVHLTGKVRFIAEEPVNEEGQERAKVDYSRDY